MALRHEWQKENVPAPEEDDGGPPPPTRAELAGMLVRMFADAEQYWRACRAGICHRRRSCSAPGAPCWDPAAIAEELHDTDPIVRGAARMMSTYGASRRKR